MFKIVTLRSNGNGLWKAVAYTDKDAILPYWEGEWNLTKEGARADAEKFADANCPDCQRWYRNI